MAGLDWFSDQVPLPQKKEPEKDILDDESVLAKLRQVTEGTSTQLNTALVLKVEKLIQKKKVIEMALAPLKEELADVRQQLLNAMVVAGLKSHKSERGASFSRVQQTYFSMPGCSLAAKIEFLKSVGRDDILTVPATKFNKLCKELEATGKQLPPTIKKSEVYTLTIRGA